MLDIIQPFLKKLGDSISLFLYNHINCSVPIDQLTKVYKLYNLNIVFCQSHLFTQQNCKFNLQIKNLLPPAWCSFFLTRSSRASATDIEGGLYAQNSDGTILDNILYFIISILWLYVCEVNLSIEIVRSASPAWIMCT